MAPESTRRASVALLVLLALAIAFTACGGGDSTGTGESSDSTRVENPPSLQPGVAEGGGGRVSTVGEGASEISVEVVPHGLAYKQHEVTIEAGETLLHLENPQGVVHDLDLEDSNGKLIADMETIGRGYADVPIEDLKPGEYTFYCSVPGHREAGMEGKVIVEG